MIEYILKEPGILEQTETDIPELKAEEVLIKVKYVGICGSDIHLYHGTYQGPHKYPMKIGHEWAGQVAGIGKEVTKFKVGDFVTGDCSRYCGTCKNCQTDKNLCEQIEKFGITIDGATAEYVVRNQKYLYKGIAEIPEDLLCVCEPVAVAAHLIHKVMNRCEVNLAEQNILVLGGGVIGVSAMMLLKNVFGCKKVSLYDLSSYRTKIAESAGAMIPDGESLNAAVEDGNYSALYEAAKYDVVLETTGVPSVFANALYLLKPAGILGCAGMAPEVTIPQKLIVTKALTITGSIGGTGDFPLAMKFIADHPEEARKLVSHYYPMANAAIAFAAAKNTESSMKVVLVL